MKKRRICVPVKSVIVLVFIVLVLASGVIFEFNNHDYIVTITDKERIYDESGSKYLVFADTDDGKSRVFANVDSMLRFKWNSSDVQAALKVGKKYKITVVGIRIPIISEYENILKYEEIKE